ncbi:MAG: sigma-54-dependent Fis family transcriptional regulator [Deltaproteobacteria bacterium]|nr:sigma-54-dependent Fis family transcriptional regulator [Deltaproteobacteria bacterium]
MTIKTVDIDKRGKILVIDDEPNMRHMLSVLLENKGHDVDAAGDGIEALALMENNNYTYMFCDIRMPNMDGMAFLEKAVIKRPDAIIIMMSAYGTMEAAIEAMKHGAYDYISKPFKPDEILLTLKKAEERERLKDENLRLKEQIREVGKTASFGSMIAQSRSMQAVFGLAQKVADYDTTVLITGESGTGKELVARGIHFSSSRSTSRFIPLNCGGIPDTLLESELFGHKKGAFTGADRNRMGLFEAASGGTIFLDEIGDLPIPLQVKLLRVLQENEIRPVGASDTRKIDARVIAATSRDLETEIGRGGFREDLFYRLNVMHIHLPKLVERMEDIPALCEFFINRYAKKFDRRVVGVSRAAMSRFYSHVWPGNVRELENVIERAVILTEGEVIDVPCLPTGFGVTINKKDDAAPAASGFSIKKAKAGLEKALIIKALEATGGNRTKATRLLEISHPSLLSKMRTYGID